jgi:hypothetical protein
MPGERCHDDGGSAIGSPRRRTGLLERWHSGLADLGADIHEETRRRLAAADVSILLITVDFFVDEMNWKIAESAADAAPGPRAAPVRRRPSHPRAMEHAR